MAMDSEIGSLEAGKRGDLIVVRTDGFHQRPHYDPYSLLGYSTKASDVATVVVDGKVVVDILDLGGQRPLVSEGVSHLGKAIAPEHVRRRHPQFGTGIDCLLHGGVDVVDREVGSQGAVAPGLEFDVGHRGFLLLLTPAPSPRGSAHARSGPVLSGSYGTVD